VPKISIVTISFNQMEYLGRCVESVRGQDFDDYEHIVVDAGSTDGSRDWLEALDDGNLQLVFKEDSGPAQGLNNGIQHCNGEIFVYLNADDELPPSALRKIAEIHSLHPSIDIVIGNGWTIDEAGKPLKFIRSDRFSPHKYAFSVGTVLQQATSLKFHLFEKGLRFNESNRYTWDTNLMFDALSSRARFLYVNDTLGYFRMQSESITASGRYDDKIRSSVDTLIENSVGPRWRSAGRLGSIPARAVKYAANSVWKARNRPEFPGLVTFTKEQTR
jgi:glycosyltransferase involved in cell wall biosynthesis